MNRPTNLLQDEPVAADEFGTHTKIAGLIRDEVLNSTEGRSIALVGNWGSGKSTIIELLRREFAVGSGTNTHLFVYDAWAHQGDSLRRAFLDDFIESLKNQLSPGEVSECTERVWNRTEIINTTKEPTLRPHTKFLLLSLALIPLGMKLFELPSSSPLIDGLTSARNIFAYIFLLAPIFVIAILGGINSFGSIDIKKRLFGTNYSNNSFSVLSFFFEKTEGHIERKNITTPTDSIRTFRSVFSQLLDYLHQGNPQRKVVIVIDNIDRVPADEAREFWSTMQTFFADNGGLRRPQTKQYWLLAPFSIEALSFLFKDDFGSENDPKTDATSRAKAYVDKTFSLSFFVPPPILANWRRYLLGKIRFAFPDHEESLCAAVRDAFDIANTGRPKTPRELKLFVNSLVALYRQRGEEISLRAMAIYISKRDKILEMEIPENLLSPQEIRLIEEGDWRIPIAALHFGVNLEEAAQLILQDPILTALRNGSSEDLRELEGRHGFFDVLSRSIHTELESPNSSSHAGYLAQLSATISSLKSAENPALASVWWAIRSNMRAISSWTGMSEDTSLGVSALLMHLPAFAKEELANAIANSLAATPFKDPEGYMLPAQQGMYWVRTGNAVIQATGTDKAPSISLPGTTKVQLDLLQTLATSDVSKSIQMKYQPTQSATELSNSLAASIIVGQYPREQERLVSLLVDTLNISMEWSSLINACATRLRTPDLNANEAESLICLALSVNKISGYDSLSIMRQLSRDGYLSHLFARHTEARARASILLATILSNPMFERASQVEQSQAGDVDFNQITDAPSFEVTLIKGAVDLLSRIGLQNLVFKAGAENQKMSRFVSAILGEATKAHAPLAIDPELIVTHHLFLSQHDELNPEVDFLNNIDNPDRILDVIQKSIFDIDKARLYLCVLASKIPSSNSILKHLEEGLNAVGKNDWEESLNSSSGSHFDLLELASKLRNANRDFALSVPAKDAALEQIRRVGNGTLSSNDTSRAQFSKIFKALAENQRSSLMRDIVDELAGQSDVANVARRLEFVGDNLTLESEVDADRIVRRIFSPAISALTDRTAAWMASVVARRLPFFEEMPLDTKEDFAWRLRAAVRNPDILSSIKNSLTAIAGLLKIDLDQYPDVSSQNADA